MAGIWRLDEGAPSVTLYDHLCAQAEPHWEAGSPLPVDLFMKMQAEGIDTDQAERTYHLTMLGSR